jgi:hypothetical protein
MTDRDELAVFDDDLVEEVAAEHNHSADSLTALARRHQSNVHEQPGVDDIVYEWRNHFHLDPVVARTDEAYYLALPEHVWEEFDDTLDAEANELTALHSLHDRQARQNAAAVGFDVDRLESDEALILVR